MKIVLLCLLITSCAHSSRVIKSERHDTYLVGYKCPNGYYFRLSDRLCHYSYVENLPNSVKSVSRNATGNYPILRKNKLAARVVNTKPVNAVKMADRPLKIDCKRVFQDMNQCMK